MYALVAPFVSRLGVSRLPTRNRGARLDYVDGLRGLAILAVLAFHFAPSAAPYGFLGVDLFLAISGFVITRSLWADIEGGSLSLRQFYLRRVRRLAPALLTMLVCSTAVALMLLLPSDLVGYMRGLTATLGLFGNVYFWRTGGYFATSAEIKPLLHTWTLGLEEQFYVLFPIALALSARFGRHWVVSGLLAVAAMSALGWVYAFTLGADVPAFFLLPTRACEFAVGAALALSPAFSLPEALRRMLSPWWLRAVGLRSYSLYLWHWPVLAFTRYYTIEITPPQLAACAFLTAMAAIVSYRLIEVPCHRCDTRAVVCWSAAGMSALLIVALAVLATGGLPGRFDRRAEAMSASVGSAFQCPVANMIPFGTNRACRLAGEGNEVVVLGNSHAQMYAPGIRRLLQRDARSGILVSANGCLPVVGPNITANCRRIAEANIAAVAASDARIVILGFNWPAVTPFWAGLTRATELFHGKRVFVIGPVATPGREAGSEDSRAIAFGRAGGPNAVPRAALARYDALAESLPATVKLLSPEEVQCASGQCRFFSSAQGALFADSNHLNAAGAELLASGFTL